MAKNRFAIAVCLLAAIALHFGTLTYKTNFIVMQGDTYATQPVAEKAVFGSAGSVVFRKTATIHAAYPRWGLPWQAGLIGGVIVPGLLLVCAGVLAARKLWGWRATTVAALCLLAAAASGYLLWAFPVAQVIVTLFETNTVFLQAVDDAMTPSCNIAAAATLVFLLASVILAVRGWRTRKTRSDAPG